MDEGAYQIGVSWNDNILQMVITGEASSEIANKIAQEVIAILVENRPKRVLIDCRNLKGRLGIIDTYFLIKNYPGKHAVPKLAILDIAEKESYYAFQKVIAANVSLNSLRYFSDSDEAMSWLRE